MSIVTIVTRTKDRPVLLGRAIESVLAQTHRDWEHIIVNDGGDSKTVDALVAQHSQAYAGRATVLHMETSVGMQNAANRGIAAGAATYICIHDDDDSWGPDHLTEVVAFLEKEGPKSKYQGVITHTELIEEAVGPDGKITEIARRPYIPLNEVSLFRLGFENPFPPIAFCFRRSAFDAVGKFDPRFNVAGDYDFNFRFLQRFEIGVLEPVSAFYHLRPDPRNEAEGNSVELAAREHKIRYNELKNHYLRHAKDDHQATLGLAFNAARYLVEIEWATHETRNRTRDLLKAIVGEEAREYREKLLAQLDSISASTEKNANNLWNDLNARARETAQAMEGLQIALEANVNRLNTTVQASENALSERLGKSTENIWTDLNARAQETARAIEGLHQALEANENRLNATVQASENALSERLGKSTENIWTDLNARARENVAATEAVGQQHAKTLEDLRLQITAIAEKQNHDLAALTQSHAAERQQTQTALIAIREALSNVSENLTTMQDELTAERKSSRALMGLGRLRLVWKRKSTASAQEFPPPPTEAR